VDASRVVHGGRTGSLDTLTLIRSALERSSSALIPLRRSINAGAWQQCWLRQWRRIPAVGLLDTGLQHFGGLVFTYGAESWRLAALRRLCQAHEQSTSARCVAPAGHHHPLRL